MAKSFLYPYFLESCKLRIEKKIQVYSVLLFSRKVVVEEGGGVVLDLVDNMCQYSLLQGKTVLGKG